MWKSCDDSALKPENLLFAYLQDSFNRVKDL